MPVEMTQRRISLDYTDRFKQVTAPNTILLKEVNGTNMSFGFPQPTSGKAFISYEQKEIKNSNAVLEPEIIYKRNDPRQNKKMQLLYARANADCSITENKKKTHMLPSLKNNEVH